MSQDLRSPPPYPVDWTVTRRDGLIATRLARTAWLAVCALKWSFQDCIDFQEGTPVDRTKLDA